MRNDSSDASFRAIDAPQGSPVTTVSIFTFPAGSRGWALAQMALARPMLRRLRGLRFHRLMGTGRGAGFTLRPDFRRYAILAVWDRESDAREFLDASHVARCYRERASSEASFLLRGIASTGSWGGINPFLPTISPPAPPSPIAVLTRATIRPWRLAAFWSQVRPVGALLDAADGLIGSVGIGETPLIHQATFSLWRDLDAMRAFAYRSGPHRQAIRRRGEERWYAEELFARFEVIDQQGTL